MTYLGLVVDTARQVFILPRDEVVKFEKLYKAILASKKFVQVKTPQRFQGKWVSFSQAVAGAKLFIRSTAERYRILSMSSDSSGFAWGGVFHLPEGNLDLRDHWSAEEAALHISTNEMLALLRVLQSSPAELRNCRVDVNVDSQVL